MEKHVKKLVLVLLLPLLITSCKYTVAIYDMNAKVDVPTNVTVKFSDTKLINMKPDKDFSYHSVDEDLIDIDSMMSFHYEDNLFNITWYIGARAYFFKLENKSDQTIRINWDDIAYVDPTRSVCRMIHDGIPPVNYSHPQTSSNIPRNSLYIDYLIPISSIHISEDDTKIDKIFYFNDKNRIEKQKGTSTAIQLPIMIKDTQINYIFSFEVSDATSKKKFSLPKTLGLIIPIVSATTGITLALLLSRMSN